MKTRWKILIAVGIFMVLSCVLSLVTLRVGSQNRLEAYKKTLLEKGEKFEVSEVLPPPVPAESNGVVLVEAALQSFGTGEYETSNMPPVMRLVAPGKALVGWQQPYWFESDQPAQTNSWEDAMGAVEADKRVIELLKQATVFPVVDFHPDYGKDFQLLLPQLSALRHAANRLSAAAVCDLHNNDPAMAVTNICTLLWLVQAEQNERVIISQMVRRAMANTAMSATWEVLQSTNLTEQQLEQLQANWRQASFFHGAEGALLMERAWQEKSIRLMRKSPAEYVRMMGGMSGGSSWSFSSSGSLLEDVQDLGKSGWEAGRDYAGIAMWRSSWGYADEQRLLRKNQILLEAMRQAQTNPVYGPVFMKANAELATLKITPGSMSQWRWLFSELFFGNNGSYTRRFTIAETAKHLTETAISLKRYQIKYGRLPASLAELAPEFLPVPPVDPMDGKLLRYRANPDGTFLLYSIGDDGKDDGGDATPTTSPSTASTPNWNWLIGHDLVWPQPATTEEIKSYYDEQAAKAAGVIPVILPPTTGLPIPMPPPAPAGTN